MQCKIFRSLLQDSLEYLETGRVRCLSTTQWNNYC